MPVKTDVDDDTEITDVLTGDASIVIDTDAASYRFDAPSGDEDVATPVSHEWGDIPFSVVEVLHEHGYVGDREFVGAKRREVDWPIEVTISYRNEHPLVFALGRASLGVQDELDRSLSHEGDIVRVTYLVTEGHEYEIVEAEVEGTRLTPSEE